MGKLTKKKVMYDNGTNRIVANTDGSIIQLKQEMNGEVIGEISLNENDLNVALHLLQSVKREVIKKIAMDTPMDEKTAYLQELMENYGSLTEEVLEVSDVYFIKPTNGRDKDGSFTYAYHAFVQEDERLVALTFKIMGGDIYGDRIRFSRSFYRYGEPLEYYTSHKPIDLKGKYGIILHKVLDLVQSEKEPNFNIA